MVEEYHFMAYYGNSMIVESFPFGRASTSVLTGEIDNAQDEINALNCVKSLIKSPSLSDLEILVILHRTGNTTKDISNPIIEWKNKKLYYKRELVSENHFLYDFFK